MKIYNGKKYYKIAELREIFGVTPIGKLQRRKQLPDPVYLPLAVYPHWCDSAFPEIKKLIDQLEDGLTITELAIKLGVSTANLAWYEKKETIPKRHKDMKRTFWSKSDIYKIEKFYKELNYCKENLYLLEVGLTRAGLTDTERTWIKYNNLSPFPDRIIGKQKRSRYFKLETIERFIKKIRRERKKLGM